MNILNFLKIFCHLFSNYVSSLPKFNVHPELPIVEEQLQPNIDWVSSRALSNSLREGWKSFLFIFCVHILIAKGLCDLQSSRISPSPSGRDSFETYFKNQIFWKFSLTSSLLW